MNELDRIKEAHQDGDPTHHDDVRWLIDELEQVQKDRDHYWNQCENILKRNQTMIVSLEEISEMPTGEPDDAAAMQSIANRALEKLHAPEEQNERPD